MEPKLPCGHFYGRVLKRQHLAGLTLTETAYSPRVQVPRHSHEAAYFCLVRQGCYTEIYGNRTRECKPLTLAFHPPGEVHSEHFQDMEGRSFNIEAASSWLERVREHTSILEEPADFQGGPTAALAVRLYREFQYADLVSPLAIEGLALEILAEASRNTHPQARRNRRPRWLERARALLQERFTEHLSLDELAASVGVHPVYLATAFRQHWRCTVGEYVRQLRIDFACRQMAQRDLPLADIALQAGFADQSHFSRTFKRHTGLTPNAYRQSLRQR